MFCRWNNTWKIQVLCDATPCWWGYTWNFKGSMCIKNTANYNPTTRCNIPEDLILLQHSYENHKSEVGNMETSGVHDDDNKNSHRVVFEVMISSSLVDEYKPFGAFIYPWTSWQSQWHFCFISGRSRVQTATFRLVIMTEANARIVLMSK